MTPTDKARAAFDQYAGMDHPELPVGMVPMSRLQVELLRWQRRNFDASTADQSFKGIVEEVGELAHAMLKHEQRIRGMGKKEDLVEAVGDAAADIMVFLGQLLVNFRIDMGTLYEQTAIEVMKRDWKRYPKDGRTE